MSDCLNPSDFERYGRGSLDGDTRRRFDDHVAACSICRAEYDAFRRDKSFLNRAWEPLNSAAATLDTRTSGTPISEAPAAHYPRIDGYDIVGVLGRGGMGIVYEAVQTRLNRRVALKLLPAIAGAAHPSLVTRFQREASAAAKLHHTNIIPIYDFGESRDGYYYAMELIRGRNLSETLRRLSAARAPDVSATELAVLVAGDGSAPSTAPGDSSGLSGSRSGGGSGSSAKGRAYYRQVARWMADAADALHYAHVNGVVHRDIKPQNLIVSTDGRIMVADFGLAKTAGDESVTLSGSLIGTYRYMSPEQVGAKRVKVDARSDVYSLGATLYELLTFQSAFSASEREELLGEILFRDPVAPRKIAPSVPVDLQTICLKAMEKAPSARYATARVMAEDLRQFIDDRPIVARPLGPIGRTVKLIRRHRAASTIGLLGLILASVVILSAYAQRRGREKLAAERESRIASLFEKAADERKAEDWPRAEQTLRQILELEPGNYDAHIMLATALRGRYYASRDPADRDEALQLTEAAAKLKPESVEPATLQGIIYRTDGQWDRAIAAHESVRRINPDYFPTYVNLGAVYALKGDLVKARDNAATGVELAAKSAAGGVMPWRTLAAVEFQLGDAEAAGAALDMALKRAPNDMGSLLLKVRFLLFAPTPGDRDQALYLARTVNDQVFDENDQLRENREDQSFLALIKRVLALAYLQNDRVDPAIVAARKSLQLGDPFEAWPRLILSIAQSKSDRGEAAREHFDAAINAWPKGLDERGFAARMEGYILWIDSAEELRQLRDEAARLLRD